MNRKKILVFIDWFSPGFRAGGPIRSCVNLIDHLSGEFDFSVVTSDTDYMEDKPYAGIRSDEWIKRDDGTRVYYFSKARLSRTAIVHLIKAEKFDFVYLNGMFSKYFTLVPLRFLGKNQRGKIILASRGMLAPSALRLKAVKKKAFLLAAKLTGVFNGITFHATNGEEVQDIKKVFGSHVNTKLAPNLPEKKRQLPLKNRVKEKNSLRLINIARIAPEKNLLYALEVLGKVNARVVFDFYGPVYSASYWEQCRAAISKLPAHVKASYKGVLDPGLVGEVLGNYHFLFMPTRSENFGHSILQSFSAGTPVIISDQTPWRNLALQKTGFDLPLHDAEKFISAIEASASLSQKEFDEFSQNAYRYAAGIINDEALKKQSRLLFL